MKAHFRFLCLGLAMLCISAVTRAQLTGAITVPSATYADLNAVITALNTSGVGAGGATITLTTGNAQTAPVGGYRLGSAVLNASLSQTNPLTFNGNGNVLTGPTGVGTNDGIWWLMGTDWVTINSFSLLDVSVTTTAASTPGNEWGFVLGKRNTTTPYDGCQHVTISNCTISLNKYQGNTTALTNPLTSIPFFGANAGILVSHVNPTSTAVLATTSYAVGDANSYNTFSGNTITNVCRGIYMGIPVSLAVNLYDRFNTVGGTTPASGNTITLGGNNLTNILTGVYLANDSSATIQNNKFYSAATQTGNAPVYMVDINGNSVGNLSVSNNYFNITTNNTTALVAACYNAVSSGATYGYYDANGTISFNGNEITGTGGAVTSAILYCFYNYYSHAVTHNQNNNNIHDITWGVAGNTGAPSFYGLYDYYNAGTVNDVFNFNGNTFYNINQVGGGTKYITYCYQYTSTISKAINYNNNTIRKIISTGNSASATTVYLTYNYTYPGNVNGTDARITMKNNIFDSIDHSAITTAAGSTIYNYSNYYGGDSTEITDNQMTNWRGTSGTGSNTFYTMYNYCYYGPNGSRVSRNLINNMSGNNNSFFNYVGYYAQYCDSNTITNQTSNGTTGGYAYMMLGYYGGYMSSIWPFGYCRGNMVKDIHMNTQNNPCYFYLGYYGKNLTFRNNTFKNISSNHASYGIYTYLGYYASGFNCQNNLWDSIAVVSNASYPSYLYCYSPGGTDTIANNRFSRFMTSSNTPTMYCLYMACAAAGAGFHVWNNEFTNFEVPATYTNHLCAIYTNGVGDYKFYNNTIRLNPTNAPTSGYQATGIYYINTGTIDLRNNIINVNVTPTGTGTTAALRRSTGTTGTSPSNFLGSSNSNIYYTPNVTNSWLYAEGVNTGAVNTYNLSNDINFNTPCGLFKSFVGHDLGSFTENNLSPSGTVPYAYVPVGPSFAESGAAPTVAPTVSTDLAGITRSNPADIGALEFSGTATDFAPPQISYTALPAITYCLSQPTVVATITDQTAVDTSVGNKPKLYFKKSTENNAFGGGNTSATNGWKWVEPTSIVGSTYTFNINYGLLNTPIAGGNTIQYFIIAQDTKSTPNAGANVASFASCPTSVNLVAANGPLNASPAPNQYTINSASLFTVAADLANICVSGSTIVRLSPTAFGTNIQWESATLTGSFTPITGATSQTYTTPVLTSSIRYRVTVYCGTSVLTSTAPITVSVNNPSILSTTPASRCGYGQLTLSATTSGAPTTVNWYPSATSTTPLATGNSFTTPNLGSSVTYYASAVVPGGSTEKVDLPPIVTPYPSYWSGPAGYGMAFHFSDTTNFYSTDVYPNGSGNLYVELQDVATSTVLYSAGPFPLTGTTGNYHNTKATIPLNFMNIPPGDYKLVCGSSTPSTLYLWIHYYSGYNPTFTYPCAYSNITGRSWAIGAYYPGQPLPYIYYWFFFFNNIISGPCENPTRYPVTATVTPSVPITASSPNSPGICTGSTATITATSTNGTYLYSWQPGSLSGATQTVSPTTSTTYIVNAVDALTGCTAVDSVRLAVNPQQPPPVVTPTNQTICQGSAVRLTATPATSFGGVGTVGTGTIVNGMYGYPSPYGNEWTMLHEQYLITPAEMNAAGIFAGPINSLGFNLASGYSGYTLNQFTIKMAHTTQTAASLTLLCGMQTVYGPVNYLPPSSAGWTIHGFSNPFVWNGTSNIMVDVTFNADPAFACGTYYNQCGILNQTATSYISTVTYYYDGNCGVTACPVTGSYGSGSYSQRPNMRFGWGKPYSVNWIPNVTGLYKTFPPAAGPLTTVDTTSSPWASPTTTQIYTAVVNASGCLSIPSNADTVFVNPAPNTTITPAGPQTICAGGSVTLCVPTASTYLYQWYSASGAIAGATSSCYTATSAGNYYVIVTNLATGCTGTSIPTAVSVNPLPTASISAAGPTTFCNGQSVVLGPVVTNASPAAIQWYNGSGPISGATGPSYTATASGTYYVTVMNGNQCSQTSNSIVVTVNTIPGTVTPGGSTTFCTGGSVQLCAPTTGTGSPYTYQWYLGAGAIAGATSSCYTATASGNYYVIVTSASTGCNTTSSSTTVTVGAAPSSAITPSGAQTLCSNGTLTLTTTSAPGLCYQWLKGGTPIAGATTNTLVVTNAGATGPGSYTVNVSICSTPACNSTTTTPVVVTGSTAPTSTFSAGGSTTFCAGNSVTFTYSGTGASSYQWNLNSNPMAGQTASTLIATQGGSYTLTATNSAGCSTTSAATTVTVNPLPAIAVTSSGPTNICTGGSVTLTSSPANFVTYAWKNGGVPAAPGPNNGSSYSATTLGSYTVTVTDANGCSNTSTPVAVIVNPLPVVTTTPSGGTNVCSGSSVTICTPTNSSYTYQWGNPGVITGAVQSCYTTGTAGSYSVKVTNTVTGCSATSAAFALTVSPPPPATATRVGPATICSGDSSRINANTGSGLSYQWNYNGTPLAGATNGSYYAKQQGTYTVTVFNGSCGATSTGVTVNVNPAPAAFITYNTPVTFCEGSAVALNANIGNGLTYMWYIDDTVTGNTSTTFVANTTGTFKLKTTNGFNCSTFSDTLRIKVNPAPLPKILRTDDTLTTAQTYASYQWFLNNSAIGGATAQTYIATQNGAYKVRVIDAFGCEGYSTLVFVQNVGVTPTATSAAIKVYPNPTTDILKIDAPVKVQLVLRDVTGKAVVEESDVKQIDLTNVASGMYLLYISDMNGNLLRVDKVTKNAN